MRARQMYSRVGIEVDLPTVDDARRAAQAVLQTLRDRLTPEEARDAVAQLPRELKELWAAGETMNRRPLKLRRSDFYELVKARGGLPTLNKAACATEAVFAALKEQLSDGEADDVLAQLPRDLKSVWMRA